MVTRRHVQSLGADIGPAFETRYDEERNVRLENIVKVMVESLPAATSNEAILLGVQDVRVYRAVEEGSHHEIDTEDGEDEVHHGKHDEHVEDVAH